MYDKRTSRRQHAVPFGAAVARWRAAHAPLSDAPAPPGSDAAEPLLLFAGGTAAFVRKRPLFAHEAQRGEFDVVTVPRCGAADVAVHSCDMHPDLRRMFIRHLRYRGAVAFGAAASEEEVFSAVAAPLLATALEGAPAALFMYGQTGSGKTHTMRALEARAAALLLQPRRGRCVRLSYFEIAGNKRARDLLSDDAAAEVTLRDVPLEPDAPLGGAARVELVGCTEAEAHSAAALLALLEAGRARRATGATFANAASSRSHAVLRLTLCGGDAAGGSLTLVDCAGSERKEDSAQHSAAQRKEGAEINASLYALKECIRARGRQQAQQQQQQQQTAEDADGVAGAPHVHVPYRSSLLTRVLAECFTAPAARLAVLGCLSPASADAEHSLSTLQAIALLAGDAGEGEGMAAPGWSEDKEDVSPNLTLGADGVVRDAPPPRAVPPAMWRASELRAWLVSAKGGAFAALAQGAPEWVTGRDVARSTPAGLTGMLCGGDAGLAAALHAAFQREVTKAAAAKAFGGKN